MLMTWLTSGTFLGVAVGLVAYILNRDAISATKIGAISGFCAGAAAAWLSRYVDRRMGEEESAAPAPESER